MEKKLEDSFFGHYGVQSFKLIDKDQKGLLADLFRETVVGQVMHHQGVNISETENGAGDLEPLTVADGLVKAAESKYGAASPVISTQFHPELYTANPQTYHNLSKNNSKFFEILHDSAIVRNNKKSITAEALIKARQRLKTQ